MQSMRLSDTFEIMKEPVRVVCEECGGDDIHRDAHARWDTGNQCWDLGTVYDDTNFCLDCAKHIHVKEVEFKTITLKLKEKGLRS